VNVTEFSGYAIATERLPYSLVPVAIDGIRITQEDIAAGRRGSCAECPLALAAHRAFTEAYADLIAEYSATLVIWATTRTLTIWFMRGENEEPITISEWLHDGRDFIAEFDNGRPVTPEIIPARCTSFRGIAA
jgi:hypothetical protein